MLVTMYEVKLSFDLSNNSGDFFRHKFVKLFELLKIKNYFATQIISKCPSTCLDVCNVNLP